MSADIWIKPKEERGETETRPERIKRRKFWTKKKILAVVLVAVILAGFYPLCGWPIWLIIYMSLVYGYNPLFVLQVMLRAELEYRTAMTRKIEVVVAKDEEVKRMVPSSVKEAIRIMEKYEKVSPVYQAFLYIDKIIKSIDPRGSAIIDRLATLGSNTIEDSHYLFFKKPLPVWKGDRVLAFKIIVINDYGRDWPRNSFSLDFILLRPIKARGWDNWKRKYMTYEVIAVGYDTTVRKDCNATIISSIDEVGVSLPNGTEISRTFLGGVYTYFYDFDQGETYTLIVPFAGLLKNNYVIGILPAQMDIKILEIGYIKP